MLMSVPPATEMFQFAGFASSSYEFRRGYPLPGGLPHSDIPGSPIARISPGLFAACHVLHRLSVPRHPPNALKRLIRSSSAAHREQSPQCHDSKASTCNTQHSFYYPPGRQPQIPSPSSFRSRQGNPCQQPVAFLSTMSKSRYQGSGIRDQTMSDLVTRPI